ncbi:MAG: SsrA-binding protein SmpB [Microgenomates group bacterium]|nr:SsrA-binding protein SmpB [Microgenomates group bacterium]
MMKIINRRFNRDYEIIEKYEAGIVLTGPETKSVKAGHIRLEDSFIKIIGNEAYLVNAEVQIYQFAKPQGYDARRTRKLLLHKKELIRLKTKLASGSRLTIAPISCYNKHGLIKLEIALAKAKKEREKRKMEKERDLKREEERRIKEYIRS